MNGKVIWITGLSGAGKTTLAKQLASTLKQSGYPPVLFDGDSLRDIFGAINKNSGNFSRESRLTLAMKYCQLCKLLPDRSPSRRNALALGLRAAAEGKVI